MEYVKGLVSAAARTASNSVPAMPATRTAWQTAAARQLCRGAVARGGGSGAVAGGQWLGGGGWGAVAGGSGCGGSGSGAVAGGSGWGAVARGRWLGRGGGAWLGGVAWGRGRAWPGGWAVAGRDRGRPRVGAVTGCDSCRRRRYPPSTRGGRQGISTRSAPSIEVPAA